MQNECQNCKKMFKAKPHLKRKYCSQECYKQNRLKNGWNTKPEFVKKNRGCLTRYEQRKRLTNFKRKEISMSEGRFLQEFDIAWERGGGGLASSNKAFLQQE